MTPEKKVQNKIIKYLDKIQSEGKQLFYDHRTAGGGSYKKGIPDLYCVYKGIHIEIEVKQVNGKLSPMQEKWRDRFNLWNIIWICPKTYEEFLELFRIILETIDLT